MCFFAHTEAELRDADAAAEAYPTHAITTATTATSSSTSLSPPCSSAAVSSPRRVALATLSGSHTAVGV